MTTTAFERTVQPYLFFEGRCEEALAFYREALGAEVLMLMRFKESPEACPCGPVDGEEVMHASFRIGQTVLMASDGRSEKVTGFCGFALSLTAADAAEAERLYGALANGGQVVMPLDKTFFSPCFGMVTDRFGMMWMVIVPGEPC